MAEKSDEWETGSIGPEIVAGISHVQKLACNGDLVSVFCRDFSPFLWNCAPKMPRQPSIAAKANFGSA